MTGNTKFWKTGTPLHSDDKNSSIGGDEVINTYIETAELINSFFSNILTQLK